MGFDLDLPTHDAASLLHGRLGLSVVTQSAHFEGQSPPPTMTDACKMASVSVMPGLENMDSASAFISVLTRMFIVAVFAMIYSSMYMHCIYNVLHIHQKSA